MSENGSHPGTVPGPSRQLSRLPAVLLASTPVVAVQDTSEARKQEFIRLLTTLPHKGEFFTDEAACRAGLSFSL